MAAINKNFKVKNSLEVAGNITFSGTLVGNGSGLTGLSGSNGASAYQVAVNNGFTGTEQDWLASLIGPTGNTGADGATGADGYPGADGLSAYQVALNNGFTGSEQDWLTSLVGPPGYDGAPGADGMNGMDGINGVDGAPGADGLSAYQVAVNNGFVGTEQDWIDGLVTSTSTHTLTNKTLSSPIVTGGTATFNETAIKMSSLWQVQWGSDTNPTFIGGDAQSGSQSIYLNVGGTRRLTLNTTGATFTGTVSGITATMVGLGNVTNESKATMFTSPTFTGTVTAPSFVETSSIRFKENIEPLGNCLDKIIQLTGVTYDLKDKTNNNRQVGLIAEQVLPIIPEIVEFDADGQVSGINYSRLVVHLLETVKELKLEIDSLKVK